MRRTSVRSTSPLKSLRRTAGFWPVSGFQPVFSHGVPTSQNRIDRCAVVIEPRRSTGVLRERLSIQLAYDVWREHPPALNADQVAVGDRRHDRGLATTSPAFTNRWNPRRAR